MAYRGLTEKEIQTLQDNGCRAENWCLVKVDECRGVYGASAQAANSADVCDSAVLGFMAERVIFEGNVNIGADCVIIDSTVSNCTVGTRTEIRNVGKIENYVIGCGCRIVSCGNIVAEEYAAMGCGTVVNVLDETGGRQVPVCPELTAQTAYIMAFYRHDMKLVNALADLVKKWVEEHKTLQGSIGDGAEICYATTIKNVDIGSSVLVRGAAQLENGTLGTEAQVLENVSASDFILSDNALLGSSCIAQKLFLGQASRLDNGFIARNSIVFANSVLECGEADGLFAGPHTVSCHRSTLLIGAATSFFNAGSGTNQSNHYYRTGPIHHGIMERGCKTGSNAYIKWPARFGQFSIISGSHHNHPDTSPLPFSYVFGNNGVTTVIPAANLKNCGVLRDVLKWKDRDARSSDRPKLDCISYDEFTPYNAKRMFEGIALLEKLRDGKITSKELRFEVSPAHIDEGIRLYRLALKYLFGSVLVDRILSVKEENHGLWAMMNGVPNDKDLMAGAYGDIIGFDGEHDGQTEHSVVEGSMSACVEGSMSAWVDMGGMIAPRSVVDSVCAGLGNGEFDSLSEVNEEIAEIHRQNANFRWLYAKEHLCEIFDLKSSCFTDCTITRSAIVSTEPDLELFSMAEGIGDEERLQKADHEGKGNVYAEVVDDLMKVINQWKGAVEELRGLRTVDAMKDFSPEMSVGFGIDHPDLIQADAANSVGLAENNALVRSIKAHYALALDRAASALSWLSRRKR